MQESNRPREYKKVDKSKMTQAQLVKYRKQLAAVRAYTKDRREWQKAVKSGNTKFTTLAEYRAAKHGALPAARTAKAIETARNELQKKVPETISRDMIDKLERLLINLRHAEQIQTQVFQEIHALVG